MGGGDGSGERQRATGRNGENEAEQGRRMARMEGDRLPWRLAQHWRRQAEHFSNQDQPGKGERDDGEGTI